MLHWKQGLQKSCWIIGCLLHKKNPKVRQWHKSTLLHECSLERCGQPSILCSKQLFNWCATIWWRGEMPRHQNFRSVYKDSPALLSFSKMQTHMSSYIVTLTTTIKITKEASTEGHFDLEDTLNRNSILSQHSPLTSRKCELANTWHTMAKPDQLTGCIWSMEPVTIRVCAALPGSLLKSPATIIGISALQEMINHNHIQIKSIVWHQMP